MSLAGIALGMIVTVFLFAIVFAALLFADGPKVDPRTAQRIRSILVAFGIALSFSSLWGIQIWPDFFSRIGQKTTNQITSAVIAITIAAAALPAYRGIAICSAEIAASLRRTLLNAKRLLKGIRFAGTVAISWASRKATVIVAATRYTISLLVWQSLRSVARSVGAITRAGSRCLYLFMGFAEKLYRLLLVHRIQSAIYSTILAAVVIFGMSKTEIEYSVVVFGMPKTNLEPEPSVQSAGGESNFPPQRKPTAMSSALPEAPVKFAGGNLPSVSPAIQPETPESAPIEVANDPQVAPVPKRKPRRARRIARAITPAEGCCVLNKLADQANGYVDLTRRPGNNLIDAAKFGDTDNANSANIYLPRAQQNGGYASGFVGWDNDVRDQSVGFSTYRRLGRTYPAATTIIRPGFNVYETYGVGVQNYVRPQLTGRPYGFP